MNIYVINNDISSADWKKLEKLFVGKGSNLINAKIDDSRIASLIIYSFLHKGHLLQDIHSRYSEW